MAVKTKAELDLTTIRLECLRLAVSAGCDGKDALPVAYMMTQFISGSLDTEIAASLKAKVPAVVS